MREMGRQRRLRRSALIGLAAMVAIAVGGSVAASQASAATARPAAGGGLSISRQFFGTAFDSYAGKNLPVFRYTLGNANGMSVQILTYGGNLPDIWVPGPNGPAAHVVLRVQTLADHLQIHRPPAAPTPPACLR